MTRDERLLHHWDVKRQQQQQQHQLQQEQEQQHQSDVLLLNRVVSRIHQVIHSTKCNSSSQQQQQHQQHERQSKLCFY